jgi:hypothetical protein
MAIRQCISPEYAGADTLALLCGQEGEWCPQGIWASVGLIQAAMRAVLACQPDEGPNRQ